MKVVSDTATPALRDLLKSAIPNRALMARMGGALQRILRRYFVAKNAEPRKNPKRQGWPKSNFWSRRVATSTNLTLVTAFDAEVTIGEPAFRTHYYGAMGENRIRPKIAKALSIPLVPEAAGIYPSSGLITGLFLRKTEKAAFLSRREGRTITNYYILLQSVEVPRDPKAAPERKDIDRELLREATEWFKRHVKR